MKINKIRENIDKQEIFNAIISKLLEKIRN